MKIELLIEDNRPLLVFLEELERDKSITVYSPRDGHGSAQRAYLRSLKKPTTAAEKIACWSALQTYCQHAIYVENLSRVSA